MSEKHLEGEGSIDLVRLTEAGRAFNGFMAEFSKLNPEEVAKLVEENKDQMAALLNKLDTRKGTWE